MAEFFERKCLADLGFSFAARELTVQRAEALMLTKTEFERLQSEEAKKWQKKSH